MGECKNSSGEHLVIKRDCIYWVNQKYFTEEAYNFNVKFANCHGKSKLLLVRPVYIYIYIQGLS